NAYIRKLRPPQIEDKALHSLRASHGQRLAQGAAIAKRGKIISMGPAAGIGFLAKVEGTRCEGFEQAVRIAEVFDVNFVEIEQAAADRQILGPIIWVPAKLEALARRDLGDDVGSRTCRDFECGIVE